MELKKSQRSQTKIKLAIQGPSGSGKTMSSLLIAQGLCNGNLAKVAIVCTENGSANLYSQLGEYNVMKLDNPHSPERYAEAIDFCVKAGMEVVILDSISHSWDYLIDFHASLPGNSFTNWNKVTPRQKAFVDKILQSNVHIISTMRVKQDYVLNERNGKFIPEKVGLKAIQRDEISYEFTIVFDIDSKHFATASKDRTQLFEGRPQFIITANTGMKILEWCNSSITKEELLQKIEACSTVTQLKELYNTYPFTSKGLDKHFVEKQKLINQLTSNISNNGSSTHHSQQ